MTQRANIVALAKQSVANHAHFTYDEIRPMHLRKTWPWVGDCSTFVTWLFWSVGAPDPNKANYDGWGNTQTLYANGTKIHLADVQPGDVVVYAADKPLSQQHTAIIVAGGADPLTVSMGQQGDPSFVHVSQDGRTPFYVRFLPLDPKPTPPKPPAPHATASTINLPVLGLDATQHGWVENAQSILLSKFGCDLGQTGPLHNGVDGIAGPIFVGALKQLQTSHGLPVNGTTDAATWALLLA